MGDLIDRLNYYIGSDDDSEDELLESLIDFLSMIDLDSLDENQIEKVDEIIAIMQDDEALNERTERVVRGGKKVRRKVCKSGYKAVDGKCVKQSSKERRTRSKAAKKSARKKTDKKSTQRKRQRSIRKR